MPMYDFKCKRCGNLWEYFCKSMKTVVKHPTCPKCGSKMTEKQFSSTHNLIIPPWH